MVLAGPIAPRRLLPSGRTTTWPRVLAEPIVAVIGPPGPIGPRGPEGTSATVIWSPPSALTNWVIPHNLNRFPSVSVADPVGESIGCRVQWLDANVVAISFATATNGTAYLN